LKPTLSRVSHYLSSAIASDANGVTEREIDRKCETTKHGLRELGHMRPQFDLDVFFRAEVREQSPVAIPPKYRA
jgi:hypothetical protein